MPRVTQWNESHWTCWKSSRWDFLDRPQCGKKLFEEELTLEWTHEDVFYIKKLEEHFAILLMVQKPLSDISSDLLSRCWGPEGKPAAESRGWVPGSATVRQGIMMVVFAGRQGTFGIDRRVHGPEDRTGHEEGRLGCLTLQGWPRRRKPRRRRRTRKLK